jgi:hypothetical protein
VEPEEMAVARKQLDKHVPAATNTHARTEKLFEVVFSLQSLLYQIIYSEEKVGDSSQNFLFDLLPAFSLLHVF